MGIKEKQIHVHPINDSEGNNLGWGVGEFTKLEAFLHDTFNYGLIVAIKNQFSLNK